jgi:arylsulfate sulfotransferase
MSSDRRLGTCVFAFCFVVLFTTILSAGCGTASKPSSTTTSTPPNPPTPPPVSVSISPQLAALGAGQTLQFTATVKNGPTNLVWKASAGSVDSTGNYTAPTGTQSMDVTVTVSSSSDTSATASATIHVVAPGVVTATANPQVASYSISPGQPGNVSVQFGTTTSYGLTTWTQPVPAGGGSVGIFVAGMKGNTLYHMRGVAQFSDGTQYMDPDMTFTTQSYPVAQLPVITATTTAGMTPQSGVELIDFAAETPTWEQVAVTDLQGNVLWAYNPGPAVTEPATGIGTTANPIKLLPNGHFLINFDDGSDDGYDSVIQEVDLTGQVIWQMTAADLNNALAAATCSGCNITVQGTHHDFAILPNGHLIVIAGLYETVSGTSILGDALIDLDQNHNPVWVWNEFDHLDTNRRPMNFPDWTHTNAILYSPDDGNLIVSIRHQSWLVKVDYANGTGAGDIIWHLGYQGDFTLIGGTDPTDWFYAEHGPSFTTKNTTGNFGLAVFDNGDDRVFPSGVTCGTSGEPACLYSTAQLLQIDEASMTATITFNQTTPAYSLFGGNAEVLPNINVEYCQTTQPGNPVGNIYEVTQSSNPQTVWNLQMTGVDAYRGQRIPSMYPGVQW